MLRPDQRNRLYAEIRERLRARAGESLEDAARRVLEEGERTGAVPLEAPLARTVLVAAKLAGAEQWDTLAEASRAPDLRPRPKPLLH